MYEDSLTENILLTFTLKLITSRYIFQHQSLKISCCIMPYLSSLTLSYRVYNLSFIQCFTASICETNLYQIYIICATKRKNHIYYHILYIYMWRKMHCKSQNCTFHLCNTNRFFPNQNSNLNFVMRPRIK